MPADRGSSSRVSDAVWADAPTSVAVGPAGRGATCTHPSYGVRGVLGEER